jgi:GAF domain-containing protein
MSTSFGRSGGPVLDEATFQKLLAAAYVLQEHHDRTQQAPPLETKSDSPDTDSDTSILAQIVETQHEIQANHLDLDGTTNLVMDRILKITGAQGAAIGTLEDDKLLYRAARGTLAGQVGRVVRPEATLSASTLLHDIVLRCPDAGTDFRVNPEITKRLGIGSLISVPVLHGGKTGGTLELVFAKADAFHDQDVRTCQLMAGLVTETLTRTSEEEWRKGLAAERASMLEVLEKIKPQLARLANTPDAALTVSSEPVDANDAEEGQCQNCGSELARGEAFCGACGTSRASRPRNDLQSKWATLWNLKNASESNASSAPDFSESVIKPLDSVLKPADSVLKPQDSVLKAVDSVIKPVDSVSKPLGEIAPASSTSIEHSLDAAYDKPFESALLPPTPDSNMSEALIARSDDEGAGRSAEDPESDEPGGKQSPESRVWMHSIAVSPPAVQLRGFWAKSGHFIMAHRGDLALGASFVLFLITVLWAVTSDHPTTSADSGNRATAVASLPAKPKRKPTSPPQPKLTMFEQFLVSAGLADAPPSPSYTGNPNIPVWVDVHTALYYCPGSELYGKTHQGKIASQHDAQMDQFEPASRKVCD